MAGIDKIYIKTLEQYKELRDWLKSVGSVKDDYGNMIKPYDYFGCYDRYEDDYITSMINESIQYAQDSYDNGIFKDYVKDGIWTQEEYDNFDPTKYVEISVMNNPLHIDIWLIRNCPIGWVQDRLKEQYSAYYDDILNKESIFDKYERNGVGNDIKIKIPKDLKFPISINQIYTNDRKSLFFDWETDYWYDKLEPFRNENCLSLNYPGYDYNCFKSNSLDIKSRKALFRRLRKWNLPEKSIVTLLGKERNRVFEIIIKKGK